MSNVVFFIEGYYYRYIFYKEDLTETEHMFLY